MGYTSLSHWIIVAIVVLVLFGRGRISETMADFGKGISSFRRGLADEGKDAVVSNPDPVHDSETDQASDR